MEKSFMDTYNELDELNSKEIVHNLENPDSLYDELKKRGIKFSSTVTEGASYIMQDGLFLGIADNMNILDDSGISIPAHPVLDEYVIENGLVPEGSLINRVLCETDNAVRVNDGTNLRNEIIIGLPQKEPTDAQYNSIIDFLYNLMVHNKFSITVGDERSLNVFKVYNLKETFPEDIVKKIKSFYKSGVLREELVKIIKKTIYK